MATITYFPAASGGGSLPAGTGVVYTTSGTGSIATAAQLAAAEALQYQASLTDSTHNSLTLSGLNGDADGTYLVSIDILSNANTNVLEIQLNGAATNLRCANGNAQVGVVTRTDWKFTQVANDPATFSTGDFIRLRGVLEARSGVIRTLTALAAASKAATRTGWQFYGEYADTATNITSISILSNQASGLASGSYIKLVRVQSGNPLA